MTQEVTDGRSLVVGRHWPALDGLRGVGMAAMLLYHGGSTFVPGAFLLLSQFFTLSGFLITGVIIDALAHDRFRLKEFWFRRFRRLMPAALVTLAGVTVFGVLASTHQQAEELPSEITASALYVVNWLFILREVSYVDLFEAPSPVQHFWSLAVEEQAYLLMPLVLLGAWYVSRSFRALATAFLVGAIASFCWMIYLYRGGAGVDRVYYGTDTRISEILIGGLLAILLYRTRGFDGRRLRWAGWVGTIAYALVWWGVLTIGLTDSTAWNGAIAIFSILSALTLLGIVSERGALPRLLAIRPLPQIGRVTYGLYLYHWPIYLWLDQDRTGLDGLPLLALRVAVTSLLAAASYHLLEVPIRVGRLRPKLPSIRVTLGPAAALLVVASATVTIDPDSRPDPFAALRNEGSDIVPVLAPPDGVLNVLLVTDESGTTVAERMEVIGEQRSDIDVVRAAPFRCEELTRRAGALTCRNWQEEWPHLVEEHDPDIVIFYLTTWPSDAMTDQRDLSSAELRATMAEALGNGLDLLTRRGAPVIWSPAGGRRSINNFTTTTGRVMQGLEVDRDDFRRLVYRMPTSGTPDSSEVLDESARRLIADAFLYQRATRSDITRVIVVGDSQARTLGYGLEVWGAERGDVLVWNIAAEGCGLMSEGRFGDPPATIPSGCLEVIDSIPNKVDDFAPDIAVVLATGRDLEPVSHDSWQGSKLPGDPEFDEFARGQYGKIADVLAGRGAHVVWMTAPCVPAVFQATEASHANERAQRLNSAVLRPLAESRTDMSIFPLDQVLCPNGQFTRDLDGVDNVRFDGIHFSPDGAIWFAETYGEEILGTGH